MRHGTHSTRHEARRRDPRARIEFICQLLYCGYSYLSRAGAWSAGTIRVRRLFAGVERANCTEGPKRVWHKSFGTQGRMEWNKRTLVHGLHQPASRAFAG